MAWFSCSVAKAKARRNAGWMRTEAIISGCRGASPELVEGSGRRRAGEQRHQAASRVERHQVVATADVGVADEDLRHGAPAGDLHHLHAFLRIGIDPDFLDR